MGSVDGDGAASAEGAAGGDGVDGGEAGEGQTGTDRTGVAAASAGAVVAPNAGVPLDRALAQTTDLSAQVALMSSAPCVRTLQTGSLGSTTPVCVTGEYFLDVQVTPNAPTERLTVAIFGHAVPKSAVNWHALATCVGGEDDAACFRNDSFHRVVPNFVIQGGNRGTGRSVFGSTFREEVSAERHSVLSHSARGVLAWAEYPIGSQFYILMADAAVYLDGNHVVFGIVVDGLDVAEKVQTQPLVNGAPEQRVSIVSAGLLDRAAPGPVTPAVVGPSADAVVGPNVPPSGAAAAAAAAAPAGAAVRLGESLLSGGNLTAGGNADGATAGAGTAATVNGNGTTDGDVLFDGERGAREQGGAVDEPAAEGEPARADAGSFDEPPVEWESARADAADGAAADGEARAVAAGAVPGTPPGLASEGV
uniref:Cychlophilin 4 n=1 Tax=Pyropia seriata TaxID=79731 RepID=A0A1W5LA96_9RHOD|nr:cychlophilin 4 [Neoporphyra seriata]